MDSDPREVIKDSVRMRSPGGQGQNYRVDIASSGDGDLDKTLPNLGLSFFKCKGEIWIRPPNSF
jgi:hypothetical protein